MKVRTLVEAICEVKKAINEGKSEISFEDMPDMLIVSLPKRCECELPPLISISGGSTVTLGNRRVTTYKIMKLTSEDFLKRCKVS